MLNANTTPDLRIWPSGIAWLHDGVLGITTGDGIRVPAHDIIEIRVKPPRAGRLSLTLNYRAGVDKAKTRFWVEPQYETAFRLLVDPVATRGDA
jgi:hypothetical protein